MQALHCHMAGTVPPWHHARIDLLSCLPCLPPGPGWINTVEASFPELIPHLSTCKSPAQVRRGAVLA